MTTAVPSEVAVSRGVTPRVVVLCLALAVLFGYMIPIIDVKLSNTFLGAAHFPPGAVAVLLFLLLVVQPLMKLAGQQKTWRAGLITTTVLSGAAAYFLYRSPGSTSLFALVFLALSILIGAKVRRERLILLLPATLLFLCAYLAFRVRGLDTVWPTVLAFVAGSSLLSLLFSSFGKAFSRNEMLTVYISCLFSCLVPGHGSETFFISNMIGPYYFAKAENKWLDFLNQYVPSWFTPALQGDKYGTSGANFDAVQDWYLASGSVPWALWITPLLMWSSLIFASYLMFSCLSVMLRAQWSDREALAFPLLRLPVEMTEDVDRNDKYGFLGRLFHNPLTWVGAGIAIFIQLLNGLHLYYPDVPLFPLEITGNFFTELPLSQMGWTPLKALPIVIGITYLLSTEVSFSMWFFFLFLKFQNIIGYYAGFPADTLPGAVGHTMGAKAFGSFQTVGAFLVYAAVIVWTGREHFKHIAYRAFGRGKATAEEREEALSYPVAFWGFLLSFTYLVGWCIFAGINPIIAVLLWLMYLIISIGLTRLIVEGGLLFVQAGWTPLPVLAQLFNAGPGTLLAPQTLVPASFVNAALMTDMRGFLLPSFIQSFKLAHDHKIRMKPLLALILSVTLISFAIGVYMKVRMGYDGSITISSWFAGSGAQKPATDIETIISGVDSKQLTSSNWVWMTVGGGITLLTIFARSRFLWFPLHPLGYLMSLSYPMYTLWFSLMLGWLAKVTITKFGGSDTYRRLIPAFLGLVMGDVFMMIVWLVVSAFNGHTGQQLMPS